MPKISVLLPTYNDAKYLPLAIESILNQSFADFELIIVNDCSTDQTLKIALSYAQRDKRITVLSNDKNSGICVSLNRGLEIAQGEYVARMDGDDFSYPNRLQQQLDYMIQNPDVVVSGSYIDVCDENLEVKNIRKYHLADVEIRKKLFRYSPFAHPATIWRTSVVKSCGGYSNAFLVGQDYDLYFRVGKYGKFGNLPLVLLKLRTHKKSSSSSKATLQEINTLYIRLKAVYEYGYKMSLGDQVYFLCQTFGLFLIPSSTKFALFNFFRKFI